MEDEKDDASLKKELYHMGECGSRIKWQGSGIEGLKGIGSL
jgi:hypothetical protein